MLIIEDQNYFDNVVALAKTSGMYEDNGKNNNALAGRLKYLEEYGGKDSEGNDRMHVRLMPDGAPMSFYFVIEKKKLGRSVGHALQRRAALQRPSRR